MCGGPSGEGFKKRKNTRGALRAEVWTKLAPNGDEGFRRSACAAGNKCFGSRQTLLVVPVLSPTAPSPRAKPECAGSEYPSYLDSIPT